MANEKLVVAAEFTNAIDASIVKGMLEDNGIPAGVINDSTASALMYGMKLGAAKVIVHESNLNEAKRLIDSTKVVDDGIIDEPSGDKADNAIHK